MMTPLVNWRPLAERMTASIEPRIRSEAVRKAFTEVPRHVFVPEFHRRSGNGGWDLDDLVTHEDPEWLATIYSNEPLITQHKPEQQTGERWITSSSSMPGLMADMIEELGLRPGMRAVEVGTGTGYNAAILCHILGDQNVATVDIDPELVELAKQQLAIIGYRPSFEPKPAWYDRLLATHPVVNVPPDWLRWVRNGGQILVDLRSPEVTNIGAWALLTVADNTATGRLMPARGMFMNARTTPEFGDKGGHFPRLSESEQRRRFGAATERKTDLAYNVVDNPDFRFVVWRALPGVQVTPSMPDIEQTYVAHHDGSWCNTWGSRALWGGPRDLWKVIETVYERWSRAGKPGLEDMTIRVTEDGKTVVAW